MPRRSNSSRSFSPFPPLASHDDDAAHAQSKFFLAAALLPDPQGTTGPRNSIHRRLARGTARAFAINTCTHIMRAKSQARRARDGRSMSPALRDVSTMPHAPSRSIPQLNHCRRQPIRAQQMRNRGDKLYTSSMCPWKLLRSEVHMQVATSCRWIS